MLFSCKFLSAPVCQHPFVQYLWEKILENLFRKMKTYLSVTFFIFMAVVQLYRSETDRFSLVVSSPYIFGHVGEDIVLPCALSSNISVEGMEIRWLKQEKEHSVLIFVSQENNENEVSKGYQERTELFKPGLGEGDVSLLLKSVKISDRGNYTCSVITSDWFSDASLSLEVIVTGNTPLISLNGHKGVGIELSCISVGWHPIPQVQWLDVADTDISARSNTELVMDQDGLYSVKSNLEVSQKDSDGIVCRVRGVQRQPESYIEIREDLFHTSSSWKAAFAVTFLFLLFALGLLGAAFLYWMKNRVIQESEKKVEESCQDKIAKLAESEKLLAEEKDKRINHLESEITQIKQDKENLTKRWDSDIQQIKDEKDKHIQRLETEIKKSKKEENNLKEQLETAKSESEKLKQECSGLQTEIKNRGYVSNQELEEMRSVRANITISQDKSSKNVKVSADGKKVRAKSTTKLTGWDCAIANESFTAGRHYWEVKVGDIHKWRLGVTSDSNFSEVKDKVKARQYYWALRWKDKKFIAVNGEKTTELTSKQKASVIGVFLDYDKGRLSFYNLDDTSHIHTLISTTKLPLYPLFNCASTDKDLVILS